MQFRPGSIGALMDEYERAARELRTLLETMTDEEYEAIADPATTNADCRSIQTMMRHVVGAGYGYANYLRTTWKMTTEPPNRNTLSRTDAIRAFDAMLAYTVATLQDRWTMDELEMDRVLMLSSWNVVYNIDQMLEHAVMHIHRHRRQTEKFLRLMRNR